MCFHVGQLRPNHPRTSKELCITNLKLLHMMKRTQGQLSSAPSNGFGLAVLLEPLTQAPPPLPSRDPDSGTAAECSAVETKCCPSSILRMAAGLCAGARGGMRRCEMVSNL